MKFKAIIFACFLLLVLDLVYLTINKSMYATLVANIQKTPMSIRYSGALFAYPLMFVGLALIVFPLIGNFRTKREKTLFALRYGGLFGLVVYGIFNATNYAIFKDYGALAAVVDTLWGSFAFFFVTWVTLMVF